MAQLRITIGSVTATRNVDDQKAQAVTTAIYENIVLPFWPINTPIPSTPAARLQAVVDWLAGDMRDHARAARLRQLTAAQQETNALDLAAIEM